MNSENYVIQGGKKGYDRLKILSGILAPTTGKLLKRQGVTEGMRCLDVGCGTGDVTMHLAICVKERGKVEGWDIDEVNIELARKEAAARNFNQITYRKLDIMEINGEGNFDVVYARFLLSHLPNTQKVIQLLKDHLKPGGMLIVEDVDFRGHFCSPDLKAFKTYVELYTKVVQLHSGNPNIGPSLPRFLSDARFYNIGVKVIHPVGLTGDVKLMAALTMENIGDALIAAKLSNPFEVDDLVKKLKIYARSVNTLMSMPRIVQTWGTA